MGVHGAAAGMRRLGGQVYDCTAVTHRRNLTATSVEDTVEVGGDGAMPLLIHHHFERVVLEDRGCRHQIVKPAKALEAAIDGALDVSGVACFQLQSSVRAPLVSTACAAYAAHVSLRSASKMFAPPA